jgi:F-type H+-transporting ATPase subunit h
LVQELYIKELKSYKPTPVKASDAEGHVQKWSAPAPPKSPEEGNLADGLKIYEEQQVEVEGQTSPGETLAKEEDWFEEEEEEHGSGH